jgi:hypothetical protein
MPKIPTLHISLLGDFHLSLDENTITSMTLPRVQSLFAYLVLHADVPVNRSYLAFLLRQSLPNAGCFLVSDKLRLQWPPPTSEQTNEGGTGPTWTLDVCEFEAALEHVRAILDPSQQRMPDVLTTSLQAALGAWSRRLPLGPVGWWCTSNWSRAR